MDSGLTTVLTTTMTTVRLPDTSTYTTSELVLCLVAPSACAYDQKVGDANPLARSTSQNPERSETTVLEPLLRHVDVGFLLQQTPSHSAHLTTKVVRRDELAPRGWGDAMLVRNEITRKPTKAVSTITRSRDRR